MSLTVSSTSITKSGSDVQRRTCGSQVLLTYITEASKYITYRSTTRPEPFGWCNCQDQTVSPIGLPKWGESGAVGLNAKRIILISEAIDLGPDEEIQPVTASHSRSKMSAPTPG